MEWVLALTVGFISALVLLYYTAKSNGRKDAVIEQKDLQINAQAKDMEFILKDIEIIQKQIFQWESIRSEFEKKNKSVDVALLHDDERTSMFQDPTIVLEVTDPYSTKLGESIRPTGSKEPKK